MLHKTKGVVFRFTRYGDTSIIVTIFTELFGIQTYIVNGVRSKTSKSKIALFQPLTLLDLVVYYKENAPIKRIKEVRCLHPYVSIPVDVKKSSIAMFLTEVVNKTIKEETHANELCEFLTASFITLDTQEQYIDNFHLIFLLRLSRFLGFGVQHVNEVLGPRMTDAASEVFLSQLLKSNYNDPVLMRNDQRRELLKVVMAFYNDHIEIGEMKSMEVLKEVLS